MLGQVTGTQARLVYAENETIASYTLDKAGALSDSQIAWLALLIGLIALAGPGFVVRKRPLLRSNRP